MLGLKLNYVSKGTTDVTSAEKEGFIAIFGLQCINFVLTMLYSCIQFDFRYSTMAQLKLWCSLAVLLLHHLSVISGHTTEQTITVELGGSIVLDCVENATWTLTDNTTLDRTDTNPNPSVLDDGAKLSITDIGEAHIGEYKCTYNGNHGKIFHVELEKLSTWDTYRMNTIIGVSAAAAFLVIAVGVALVCKYRWRPEKEEGAGIGGGWSNPAMVRNGAHDNDLAKNKVAPSSETKDTYI